MSVHLEKVELTDSGKVRLRILTRNAWGNISKRQQVTFSRREFMRALDNAGVTVPWREVIR